MALKGNKYGTHRVIEPKGVLTQAAYKIDNQLVYENIYKTKCEWKQC